MASPSATDAAAIARIITHMNRDHASSLHDYAEFYCRLPRTLARTATLTMLSLSTLTLTVTSGDVGRTVSIPLTPAMASYSEARVRLVAMAEEAERGLGRGRRVERWIAPGPVGVTVSALVLLGYWASWNGAREFATGGFVRETLLGGRMDWLAQLLLKWHMAVFWGIVAIHSAEALFIHRTRLGKHGITAGSGLWWAWMVTTFIEGVGSIKRFDGEVKRVGTQAQTKSRSH